MNKTSILVIEDEKDIAAFIKGYLVREGYLVSIVRDGQEGLLTALNDNPDLIVLDWMLPNLDGLSLLKQLRRSKNTPIIMLSARADDSDRILALEFGADDYLVKPFHPGELVARVKTVLRRSSPAFINKADRLILSGLTIDRESYEVSVEGSTLDLTPNEFELLYMLASYPGKVFSRNQLLDLVWGEDFIGIDRVVDVQISNLRSKLRSSGLEDMIVTIRGIGYKLQAPQK